ncbi:MAG: hypothetical protein ACRD5Z_13885 [Bryobacteraceae bacterium]
MRRQDDQVRSARKAETRRIPYTVDYRRIPGLRNEARQKLAEIQPSNLGQAGRISGVTPSDIGILQIWLNKLLQQPNCELLSADTD